MCTAGRIWFIMKNYSSQILAQFNMRMCCFGRVGISVPLSPRERCKEKWKSLLTNMETHWLISSDLLCHSENAEVVSLRKLKWSYCSDKLSMSLLGQLHHGATQHWSNNLPLPVVKYLAAAKSSLMNDCFYVMKQILLSSFSLYNRLFMSHRTCTS